jgi:hypothetical protein
MSQDIRYVVVDDEIGLGLMRPKLFFSMRDGDLTLQARKPEDSRLLQFVPREVFVGDFPKTFLDDYVHWLDIGTGEVEFRPIESPWTPDPSNWRLTFYARSVFRKISGDGAGAAPVFLIDIHSDTFQMIASFLSSLESQEHITVTFTHEALEASLNRLHLVFFFNQNSEFECQSMPGYVIDESQSCGTMFGLKHRLVLRPSNNSSDAPRRVIIPQGDIEFRSDGDFVSVSIKTGTARHVHWHEYTIDTDLGRLTGNVSLHSKLYQCYLHALTSHCLPDPLLGHTGTEESLGMLQSATFLSFQRLGKDDAKLLSLISDLTPVRSYYPLLLKWMITVKWNDLPILSQHHDFYPVVLSILDHAHAMEALYDNPFVFETPLRQASLLNRSASRNKLYYPNDLQSLRHSPSSTSEDVPYKSRDVADGQGSEHIAYQMSWSIWNDRPSLSRNSPKLWDAVQSWHSLGLAELETGISLRYSRYWLTFDAAKDWLGIYDVCQEASRRDRQDTKIKLAFSLSAASFSGSDYADIIPLIQIFATDSRLRGLTSPPSSHYKLSDGTYPDHERLSDLISQFALPMQFTPAQDMEIQASTTKMAAKNLRRQEYNNAVSEMASDAAHLIVEQWPRIRCDLPHEWFNAESGRESVEAYLQSISRNIAFAEHIHHLEAILDRYGTSLSPNVPYVLSPQFTARPSKAPSPSLREVSMSRANFPQPTVRAQLPSSGSAMPSATVTKETNNPLSARADGLSSLIQDLRQSRESLIQLYGEDLDQSYADLQRKGAPFLTGRSVPPREALLKYRDLCSQRKDTIFSELSCVLAPSQKNETIIGMSGLWPRLTPRSVLRELSRDRVRTLPDQWKHAIVRYAVAFLAYQQSQRLLELSSRRRDDELLREMETTCESVAAGCTPDWLLIQVS